MKARTKGGKVSFLSLTLAFDAVQLPHPPFYVVLVTEVRVVCVLGEPFHTRPCIWILLSIT